MNNQLNEILSELTQAIEEKMEHYSDFDLSGLKDECEYYGIPFNDESVEKLRKTVAYQVAKKRVENMNKYAFSPTLLYIKCKLNALKDMLYASRKEVNNTKHFIYFDDAIRHINLAIEDINNFFEVNE